MKNSLTVRMNSAQISAIGPACRKTPKTFNEINKNSSQGQFKKNPNWDFKPKHPVQ
jgi:hypothetical protein